MEHTAHCYSLRIKQGYENYSVNFINYNECKCERGTASDEIAKGKTLFCSRTSLNINFLIILKSCVPSEVIKNFRESARRMNDKMHA